MKVRFTLSRWTAAGSAVLAGAFLLAPGRALSRQESDAPGLRFTRDRLEITLLRGHEMTREVRLENPGTELVEVAVLEAQGPGLSAVLEGDSATREREPPRVAAGDSLAVTVHVSAVSLELGDHEGTLRARTAGEPGQEVLLPVVVHVVEHEDESAADPIDQALGPEPEKLHTEGLPGRIVFDRYVHDFGSVVEGERLSTTFAFRNEGAGDLVIQGFRRMCHCSIGTVTLESGAVAKQDWKDGIVGVLAPGQSGSMECVWDTTSMGGYLRRYFYLYSSDLTSFRSKLTVSADIVQAFATSPPSAHFGDVVRSSGKAVKLKVRPNPGLDAGQAAALQDFEIVGYQVPSPPVLDVDYRLLSRGEQGPEYEITARVRPDAPFGALRSAFRLQIENCPVRELAIGYDVTVLSEIQFTAQDFSGSHRPPARGGSGIPQLDFGVLRSAGVEGRFLVENLNPAVPYVPTSVRIEARFGVEPFAAEIVTLEEGVRYEIVLRIVEPPTKFFRGFLHVESDSPSLPVQKLEFKGQYTGT